MSTLTKEKAQEVLQERWLELVDARDGEDRKVLAAKYAGHQMERIFGREWKKELAGFILAEEDIKGTLYVTVNNDGLKEFVKGTIRGK